MKSKKTKLPNGMTVYSKRSEEAHLMYGEVGAYIKHGLSLQRGGVVFDVGANIGIFSLWAYEQCSGDILVYAFEPVPEIFAMLSANFNNIDPHQLKALNIGLSHQATTTQFAYYPNATFASTAYPDAAQVDNTITETLLRRSLDQLPMPLSLIRHLPSKLQTPFIWLLSRHINQRQWVNCQLQTISQVIHDHHIERIDFLKIDAEKSELDVLNGIDPADWTKVHQIFAEVHDRESRVDQMCELLRWHGFRTIICEQDPFFANTDIHALYAVR